MFLFTTLPDNLAVNKPTKCLANLAGFIDRERKLLKETKEGRKQMSSVIEQAVREARGRES